MVAFGQYVFVVRPTGKITFFGIVMSLGLGSLLYWCIMFLPVWIDHIEVKDACVATFNKIGHPNIPTQTAMREFQVELQTLRFATHKEIDPATGEEVEKEGLPIADDNPVIEVDEVNQTVRVRYEYDRVVMLKPTDKQVVIHMIAEKFGHPVKR